MDILNVIDKIFKNSHFKTILAISFLVLILLFCLVLFLGIRDNKKSKRKKTHTEEDVKDITFDMPADMETIKEDVTFEMPSLTQNLENFKKSLEEEIQKEDMAEVRKTSGLILPKEKKSSKVLDLDEIEDTSISEVEEKIIQTKKVEETNTQNKELNIHNTLKNKSENTPIKDSEIKQGGIYSNDDDF